MSYGWMVGPVPGLTGAGSLREGQTTVPVNLMDPDAVAWQDQIGSWQVRLVMGSAGFWWVVFDDQAGWRFGVELATTYVHPDIFGPPPTPSRPEWASTFPLLAALVDPGTSSDVLQDQRRACLADALPMLREALDDLPAFDPRTCDATLSRQFAWDMVRVRSTLEWASIGLRPRDRGAFSAHYFSPGMSRSQRILVTWHAAGLSVADLAGWARILSELPTPATARMLARHGVDPRVAEGLMNTPFEVGVARTALIGQALAVGWTPAGLRALTHAVQEPGESLTFFGLMEAWGIAGFSPAHASALLEAGVGFDEAQAMGAGDQTVAQARLLVDLANQPVPPCLHPCAPEVVGQVPDEIRRVPRRVGGRV